MYRQLLACLDGSVESERILPWIRLVFPKARLTLLRVVEPVYFTGPEGSYMPPLMFEDRGEEYLKKVAKSLRPAPRTMVRIGSPAGEILEGARENRCEAIVLGSRGGAELQRRVFGGTVENLLHSSQLPLFIIPAGVEVRAGKKIRKVAVPLDGSEIAERIMPIALKIAQAHKAALVLIHCQTGLDEMERLYAEMGGPARRSSGAEEVRRKIEQIHEQTSRYFDRASRRWGGRAPVKTVLTRGKMPEAVLDAAQQHGCDLMAMSVHGHGALKHMFLGATASRLIQGAAMPVLAARHDALKALAPA